MRQRARPDKLSTIPYIPVDAMALSLAGERSFKAVSVQRWKAFANRALAGGCRFQDGDRNRGAGEPNLVVAAGARGRSDKGARADRRASQDDDADTWDACALARFWGIWVKAWPCGTIRRQQWLYCARRDGSQERSARHVWHGTAACREAAKRRRGPPRRTGSKPR